MMGWLVVGDGGGFFSQTCSTCRIWAQDRAVCSLADCI